MLGTRRASEEANLVSTTLSSASIRRKESVSEATTELSSIVEQRAYLARGSPRLVVEIFTVETFVKTSITRDVSGSSFQLLVNETKRKIEGYRAHHGNLQHRSCFDYLAKKTRR